MRRAVELLILAIVTAVVMGFLLMGPGCLSPFSHSRSPQVKTISTISQIDAACVQYFQMNHAYPDTVAGIGGGPSMQSIFMAGVRPKPVDQISAAEWDAVSAQLLTLLQTVDRDDFNQIRWPLGHITDAWGATIRYRPARYYPCSATSSVVVDAVNAPHRDSYQLWSPGRDGVDQFGDSDDITNWQ
jgi:hypothetical protein